MPIIINDDESTNSLSNRNKLYRTLWRWHFYAGVFAIPFILILSVTGAIYLFKPQIDSFTDAPYRELTLTGDRATAEKHISAALNAVPNASLSAYELPRAQTDAVNILLNQSGDKIRVFVDPNSLTILNIVNEKMRFINIVHDIHGELLSGTTGSILVELAACWGIVLVLTGLYLWWPRSARGFAGVLYPRLSKKGRVFWRDLHSVTGIWVSFFVLFLLISGLPWAFVWGNAFKEFRQLTGTTQVSQDWNIAGEHAHHMEGVNADGGEDHSMHHQASLDKIISNAQELNFAYPVLLTPPSTKSHYWAVKSNAQNRMLRADASIDPMSGEVINQQNFSSRHVIDRAIGIGVAAHEGQLFGWFNQLLGLLTACGLILMTVAGFILWRKRAPEGVLGAPPVAPDARLGKGFVAIILLSAILLPLLGISLIIIAALEFLFFARWQKARVWLGLQ